MLHAAVAARSFRRYSTYLGATVAGIFTNSVFGIIACFVYGAVWKHNPSAGGYDLTDAITYAWLGQAMIMTACIFGGGSPDDLAQRVKSGDIALDFYRPVGILGWYLAADLGRAAYHLMTRGLAPTVLGALLFDLRWPAGALAWVGFAVAVVLAVVVSFALRFLVALSAFWLLDDTGVRTLSITAAIFFSGLTVPLVIFPGWSRDLVMTLPWAAYVQVPADIWLGQRTGVAALEGLAIQADLGGRLLGACAAVLRVAERRVVVQGG